MIWFYLLSFISSFIDVALSFLPRVTELPLGSDAILTQAVGWMNSLLIEMPPFVIVRETILWLLAFELTLLTLRLLRITR